MAIHHQRKTRRLTFRGIFTILFIVFCLVFGAFSAQAQDDPQDMQQYKPVYVVEGDTLWSLVDEHYDTNNDIRANIYQVKQINDLGNNDITPGQIIYFPIS